MYQVNLNSKVRSQITINRLTIKTVRSFQILIHKNLGKFKMTIKLKKVEKIICLNT